VTTTTELPPLVVDVTAALIVAGAIATRDYQDVHHDAARARELGSPDIFMNIHTTTGLVSRYVTDWAGPAARLQRIALRLGAPNYPGDVMTLTGRVLARNGTSTEIEVVGRNALGDHVVATVVLAVPGPDAA
jgi:acyl dehydratase